LARGGVDRLVERPFGSLCRSAVSLCECELAEELGAAGKQRGAALEEVDCRGGVRTLPRPDARISESFARALCEIR
jgi:hypothetical protein